MEPESPVVQPSVITFRPPGDYLEIHIGQQQRFSIHLENAPTATTLFTCGDSVVSNSLHFTYSADYPGSDSLSATVILPERTLHRMWRIQVNGVLLPPPVRALDPFHGSAPASLELSWVSPNPQLIHNPVARYLVGVSPVQMTSPDDWFHAVIIDEVDKIPGQVRYWGYYDFMDHPSITPGQDIWIVVRVEDTVGGLSEFGHQEPWRLSAPYHITGEVLDSFGDPLPDILVNYGCDTCQTITDLEGRFTLGPLRNLDAHMVRVSDDGVHNYSTGEYYDVTHGPVDSGTISLLRFRLLRARSLAEECGISYDREFLTYFRHITLTDRDLNDRPERTLMKWEHYPLMVFREDVLNSSGTFSLGAVTDTALTWWNRRLGEDSFLTTDDRDTADLVVVFPDGMAWLGVTEIIEPIGGRINVHVPEKMQIRMKRNLQQEIATLEIMLHELGHALCLGGTQLLCKWSPSHELQSRRHHRRALPGQPHQ
ncbi:MAG: hypothetical protein ABIF77_06690 [bacterium]